MAARDVRLTAVFAIRDQLSPILKTMSDKFESFKKVVDSADFKEFNRNLDRFKKNLSNVGGEISSMASTVAAPAAAVAASVGLSLASITQNFMDAGGAIDDVSARIGVPIDQLQQLRYAAQMSGASMETLDNGLNKFNQNLANAAGGKNANLAALMEKLGIAIKDADGNIRNAADILPEFADAFARNENPAVRARMAVAAFGKAGVDLVPMLAGGSEELAKLTNRAQEMGFVMAEEDVKAAASLGDHFDEMNMSIAALGNTMGAKMAPVLEVVFDRVSNLVAANREAFSEKFENIVQGFAKAIEDIDFEGIIDGLMTIADYTLRAFNALGGFNTVVTALSVFLGGKAVMSVVSFAGTVISLGKSFAALATTAKTVGLAMAGALGPASLVIAGIAAGASLIIANWDSIWPAIKAGASGLFSFLASALDVCYEKFGAVVGAIFDIWKSFFTGNFPGLLKGFDELISSVFGLLPGKLGEVAQEWYKGIKELLGSIGTAISDFIKDFDWSSLVPDWLRGLFGNAKSSIGGDGQAEASANFASMPVSSSGTMTGTMRIGVYGYGGAEPRVESINSSDNLEIEGDVGRSDREQYTW